MSEARDSSSLQARFFFFLSDQSALPSVLSLPHLLLPLPVYRVYFPVMWQALSKHQRRSRLLLLPARPQSWKCSFPQETVFFKGMRTPGRHFLGRWNTSTPPSAYCCPPHAQDPCAPCGALCPVPPGMPAPMGFGKATCLAFNSCRRTKVHAVNSLRAVITFQLPKAVSS